MALIPPFFLDCVVSIGVSNKKTINWIGTGFIVGRPIGTDKNNNKLYNTFIVTNKHVLENKPNIVIRFNSLLGNTPLDVPIVLINNGVSIWAGHNFKEIDVAAFPINPNILNANSAQFQYFRMDEHVMHVSEMKSNGVSEGDGIFVLGFPMGIVGKQKNHVIARVGAIARIRDVIEGQQTPYLIDASVYPGNSGGPVIIRPELIAIEGTQAIKKASLIGIVKSYVSFSDIAISQQTGNPRVIFEENSGLALVESFDSIELTVNNSYQKTNGTTP